METEKNVSVMSVQKGVDGTELQEHSPDIPVADIPPDEPQEIEVVVEVVDMRIEHVQHRKHERTMRRTLRWPIHSNTHRVTF